MSTPSSRRPNILLITADQLRADALGCYGNPICRTPNLDALAARGVLFENGLTPNPICVPARATITTGNYPHVCTGFKDNTGRIRDDQVKLAAHFAASGYETYACGKLHYVPYAPPGEPRLLHGFQHCELTESGRYVWERDPQYRHPGLEDYIDYLQSVGWGGYSRAHGSGNNDVRPCPSPLPKEHTVDHWVADCTIRRLAEHARDRAGRPFFIMCAFPKPHTPLDPPYEVAALYDPRELPDPFGGPEDLPNRTPVMEQTRYTHGISSLSPAAIKVIRAYYYGLVTWQDEQIGRVLATLEQSGRADDTIVLFTADHGDLLGDFGSFFKCNFQDGSLRVPYVVSGPGVPAGQRRGQLVGLQDILPTLAARAGCPLPKAVQGQDLSPILGDAGAAGRELFYSQCFDKPRQIAMVTDGRWKYCYNQEGPLEELYDRAADPKELVNLATRADGRKLLPEWRDRLMAEARRLGDDDMLPGGKLPTTPLDRSGLARLPICGLGWRPF